MKLMKNLALSLLLCGSLLGSATAANAVPEKGISGTCAHLNPKKEYGLAIVNDQIFALITEDGKPRWGIKLLFKVLKSSPDAPLRIQLASPRICEGAEKTVYVNGLPVPVELIVDMSEYIK